MSHRNFALLLSTDVVSTIGTGMAIVAVPFAVLATGGTATDIGYVTVAQLAAALACLLLGGVVADRLPRTQVLVASNVVQAVAQAVFGALVIAGHPALGPLVGMSALRGVGFGFQWPAAEGLVPQTVPADQLSTANAILRVGMNSAQIGGAAVGGIVVAGVGPGWALVADAASFLLASLLRLGMRIEPGPVSARSGLLSELREGWQAFVERQWLWAIVTQFAFLSAIFVGGFEVLGPVVAKQAMGGAAGWGAVLAAQGVGAILGALLMMRWRPSRLLLVAELALPGVLLPTAGIALPVSLGVMCAGTFVAGASLEVFIVNWSTAMQQQIPPELLSRVSSYDALGSMGLTPVGTLLAGPLATLLGLRTTLWWAVALVGVGIFAVLLVPDVRRLHRLPDRPDQDPAAAPGVGGAPVAAAASGLLPP
jgi:MFS family permease